MAAPTRTRIRSLPPHFLRWGRSLRWWWLWPPRSWCPRLSLLPRWRYQSSPRPRGKRRQIAGAPQCSSPSRRETPRSIPPRWRRNSASGTERTSDRSRRRKRSRVSRRPSWGTRTRSKPRGDRPRTRCVCTRGSTPPGCRIGRCP